ncbi:hypothetical protein ISR92_03705 [Patescibacteria group bacterium]|nr:hypothetical protein [Patescibacteria group bacterium]
MTQTSPSTERTGTFKLNAQNEELLTGTVKMDTRCKDVHLEPGPENLIHISAVRFIALKINLSGHKEKIKLHVMESQKPGQPWRATLEARNGTDVLSYANENLGDFLSIEMK